MSSEPVTAIQSPFGVNDKVPLGHIDITAELCCRTSRSPRYEAESRALSDLMQALTECDDAAARGSDKILQKLVETAVDLCGAHSAGISIIEKDNGRELFRWRALAGRWAKHRGSTMPRHPSPCGTVVDRNSALLIAHPARHYPFPEIEPSACEALLIPFEYAGAPVGTIWIAVHDERHKFDAEDHRLMLSLSRFAAAAYQLQMDREARFQLTHQLESELAAARLLQETSLQLIREDDVKGLYEEILDAAISVMRSDFASIQMLHEGELRLLGRRGLDRHAASYWQWVRPAAQSPCGVALGTGRRVTVPDVQSSALMAGSEDLKIALQNGIRAIQSTPLLSRTGQAIGMISTHWRQPHQPSERDLRLFDVLARQAADLIE